MRRRIAAVLAAVLFPALSPGVAAAQGTAAAQSGPLTVRRGSGLNLAAIRLVPEQASGAIADDPVGNGVATGALIGAGAAVGLTAITFARCNSGCEAPSPGPTYLMAAGVGAGAGAAIGWLVDKAHKRRPPAVAAAVRIAPIVSRERKAVTVALAF